MKTISMYEAFDGKIFKEEEECFNYECEKLHSKLFNITFWDENNNVYFINKDDVCNDSTYDKCEKLSIPIDSFEDFVWLTEECGWYEFTQISQPGIWKREVHNHHGIWINE